MKTCYPVAALAILLGMPVSSEAQIPFVYDVENTGTNCAAPPLPLFGNLPSIPPLPDPFLWASTNNGTGRATNFADWICRRAEIKAQIENYEIGTKPAVDPGNVTGSYTNGVLTVIVTIGTNTLTLTSAVILPSGSGPFPAVIGMNSPSGNIPSSLFSSRNIAQITFSHNQVTVYGNQQNTDPYYKLYGPALNSITTGQYSAWAWGVSRIIDGLQLVTNTLPIDLKHLCVTGCSYAGKMALFSGAFDERIALTIAQESGGGGATSWRYSSTEPSGTVECIDNTDHNWFMESMFQFSAPYGSRLPEDHHELCAMVAPRALLVTANPDYTWLSNPSCYVCSRAAQQIYNTLGISDRFGFSIVGGHAHCTLPTSQYSEVGAFLDKFLLGITTTNTSVATYPTNYSSIDYARWSQWWGTGTPVFPQIKVQIPTAATEGDGTLAGKGSVSVNMPMPDVVVNLTSSDTSEVTVPASVVIPAGQTNAVFDLTIVDDSLLDGDQVATITATISNTATTGQAQITVHDNDTATLSVTLPAGASESAGTLTNAGSVSIATTVTADIPVSLSSSDTSRLTVPASTVIPAGKSSGVFNLTFVNNSTIEGAKTVSVTAHVPNWTDGSASMTIFDDDLPPLFWSVVPSPQFIGEPFHVTITAQDLVGNIVGFPGTVNFSALVFGGATATNMILNPAATPHSALGGAEYVRGYSFTPRTNLKVTAVRSYFGDKVSIWSSDGRLVVSQNVTGALGTWVETPLATPVLLQSGVSYRIAAHENGVGYTWGLNLPATFADGTIDQAVWGTGDVYPGLTNTIHWYFVDLRYSKDVTSLPVSIAVSGNFTNGTWSGNVAVLQAASNVMLQASAGPASGFGLSNPFDVLGTPKLAITSLGNSVVLSWPVAAGNFQLEQSSTLSNWTDAPGVPAPVGDRYNVTNAVQPAPTYFRLKGL